MDAIPKFRMTHYEKLAFNEMAGGIVGQARPTSRPTLQC